MKKIILVPALVIFLSACSLGIQTNTDNSMGDNNKQPLADSGRMENQEEISYNITPGESELKWEGRKILVNTVHHGTIEFKSGEIVMAGNELEQVNAVVDMQTIENLDQTDPAMKKRLEGHLRSSDFFAVEEHPTAEFNSTRIEKLGDNRYLMQGNLSIKGVTEPIEFEAEIVSRDPLTVRAGLVFDRSKYNVRYGSGSFFDNLGDNVISDEILLDIKVIGK